MAIFNFSFIDSFIEKRFDECHLSNHNYRALINRVLFNDQNDKGRLSVSAGLCL